ncbi:MAG: cysteine hydrolase [Nitrososphaerota archaeon]|nr:cysteine hydrolase [Nitrososphaerota archaeon]
MQNDFCSQKGASGLHGADLSSTRSMIPKLVRLIDEARKVSFKIIYVLASYSSDQNWYISEVYHEQMLRKRRRSITDFPVCQEGTWGWRLVDELKPLPNEVIVNKHRWTAFLGTDLEIILRNKGVKSLILSGVTSNVCVDSTARDAFLHDYYVVFTSDCTASYNEKAHLSTLETIDAHFGVVATSEEIMDCWRKAERPRKLESIALT